MTETADQRIADSIDLGLDRFARLAYERREKDELWRRLAVKLDAARNEARKLMHPARRTETQ